MRLIVSQSLPGKAGIVPKIALITDTDSSLPEDLAARYQVQQVPITVQFGQESFLTGAGIDAAALFERVDRENKLPTTAAPSPGQFLEAYQAAAEAAQQGASKKECITCALDTRARSHLFAALATVKYLALSGRVGTVSTDLTPGLSVHTGVGLVGVAIVAGPSYQPPTQAANFDTASQVGSPCVFRWRQLSLSK